MELNTNIEWIKSTKVYRKSTFTPHSYFYVIIVIFYAFLIPWMYNTIGEPYNVTLAKNEELREKAIDEGKTIDVMCFFSIFRNFF